MNTVPLERRVVMLGVILAQVLFVPILVAAQSQAFEVSPIVKRGDPSPDGGRFFDCADCQGRVIGLHAFNNRGDVAIAAEVVSGLCFSNRFLISRAESIRLADFCQITEFGKLTFLGPVNINDSGQAAINAGITIDNRIVEMLLLFSGGQLHQLVQEGDASPIGTIFKGCGFGQPSINATGDVAFFACGETADGVFSGDGVFKYSGGQITKVVTSLDPSPIGGQFLLNFIPAQAVQMNDRGDVLFQAGVFLDPFAKEKLGLFLATASGIRKIEVDEDSMPGNQIVKPDTFGFGDLNNSGDVVFAIGLAKGQSDSGIFLRSGNQTDKIMAEGEPTPLGGKFATLGGQSFLQPRINNAGAVALRVNVTGGSASSAIFLGSAKALVKVAAVGDKLPTGGKIREITSFALNDLAQVAFYADVKNGPKGVFLATPVPPQITSIKLKHKKGSIQLRVNGSGMIPGDTVIEINGTPVGEIDYPADFRQDGGLTTRVISRDARLEQLMPEGQTVQVTVFNSLTNLRSLPIAVSR